MAARLKARVAFRDGTGELGVRIEAAAEQHVGEAAVYAQTKIKQRLSGNRTGDEYQVPGTVARYSGFVTGQPIDPAAEIKPGTTYRASAPGEAPAVRLGYLRNSIVLLHEGTSALVGPERFSDEDYGLELEIFADRPYLRVTLEEESDALVRILADGWTEDIEAGA